MRKVLGNRNQYYIQTNNASVFLMEHYTGEKKIIACGPESFAMGLDIAGYDMSIFTPGEQPGDSITMIMHNPINLPLFEKRRKLDYTKWSENEVPQLYDVVGNILYGKKICEFKWECTLKTIKENIFSGNPVMLCGDFPAGGHYVLAVGFDEDLNSIIFNDPYPNQWIDGNGYNRTMSEDFFNTKISPRGFTIPIFKNI